MAHGHPTGLLANPQTAGRNMLASGFNDKRHMAARKALMQGDIDGAAAMAERVADSNAPWAMYVLAACEWFRGRWMRTAAYITRGLRLPPEGFVDRRYQDLLLEVQEAFKANVPRMLSVSPRPKLSVCLITRDEERSLERCLRSVKPIADEIIVVDTGSTDQTVEIAKRMGAKVSEIEWPGDFSIARNAALEKATGDWVLSIDADEWLDEVSHLPVRACLADPSCFFVPLIRSPNGAQSFANTRLFPNTGARWKGRIHESMDFDHKKVMPVQLSAMVLNHDGYMPDVSDAKAKGERNRALIEAMKQDGSEEAKTAGIYHALNTAAHTESLDEGIDALKAVLDDAPQRSGLSRQLFMNLTTRLLWAGRYDEALEYVTLAEENNMAGLWTCYTRARLAYEAGRREEAAAWASQGLLARDDEGPVERLRTELKAIKEGTF